MKKTNPANDTSLNIFLRDVKTDDLPIFFENQLDPDANYMVAFTAKDPNDWNHFKTHWEKILSEESVTAKTIVFYDNVAGSISKFQQFGLPAVGYWIGKDYWGKGIATQALTLFLDEITERPLYARVAKDNIGSRSCKICRIAVSYCHNTWCFCQCNCSDGSYRARGCWSNSQ